MALTLLFVPFFSTAARERNAMLSGMLKQFGISGPCHLDQARCRANVAHMIQSRPDSGPGFLVKSSKPFKLSPLHSEAGLEQFSTPDPSQIDQINPHLLTPDRQMPIYIYMYIYIYICIYIYLYISMYLYVNMDTYAYIHMNTRPGARRSRKTTHGGIRGFIPPGIRG